MLTILDKFVISFKKNGYLPQFLSKNDQTISDFLYKNMDYLFNYTAFYQMAAQLGLNLATLEEKINFYLAYQAVRNLNSNCLN